VGGWGGGEDWGGGRGYSAGADVGCSRLAGVKWGHDGGAADPRQGARWRTTGAWRCGSTVRGRSSVLLYRRHTPRERRGRGKGRRGGASAA